MRGWLLLFCSGEPAWRRVIPPLPLPSAGRSAFATDEAVEKGVAREEYADVKEYLLAQFGEVFKLTPCIERTPVVSRAPPRQPRRSRSLSPPGLRRVPATMAPGLAYEGPPGPDFPGSPWLPLARVGLWRPCSPGKSGPGGPL